MTDDKLEFQLQRIHDSLAELVRRGDNQEDRSASFARRLFWLLFGMMGLWLSLFILFGFVGFIFFHFDAVLNIGQGHPAIHSRLDTVEDRTKARFDRLENRVNSIAAAFDQHLKTFHADDDSAPAD